MSQMQGGHSLPVLIRFNMAAIKNKPPHHRQVEIHLNHLFM